MKTFHHIDDTRVRCLFFLLAFFQLNGRVVDRYARALSVFSFSVLSAQRPRRRSIRACALCFSVCGQGNSRHQFSSIFLLSSEQEQREFEAISHVRDSVQMVENAILERDQVRDRSSSIC